MKTNLRTYKIKDLKGETIIRIIYKKELKKLQMSYYLEPDSHINNKIKILGLSKYATKKTYTTLQALIHLKEVLLL